MPLWQLQLNKQICEDTFSFSKSLSGRMFQSSCISTCLIVSIIDFIHGTEGYLCSFHQLLIAELITRCRYKPVGNLIMQSGDCESQMHPTMDGPRGPWACHWMKISCVSSPSSSLPLTSCHPKVNKRTKQCVTAWQDDDITTVASCGQPIPHWIEPIHPS